MEKYLCGEAALLYHKVPSIRGTVIPREKVVVPEYVIFKKAYIPQDLNIHTCSIKGAERYVRDGVCTLPLVFLQCAHSYGIHDLILLGLQICSTPEGKDSLSTVQELRACALELKGHRGRAKALRALKYVREGSRSPKESELYMALACPGALGGCAFRSLKLNVSVSCKKHGSWSYLIDICDSKKKVAIEYNSFQHHNNTRSYSEDEKRASRLRSEGYEVFSVKPDQLRTVRDFEILVRNLAKALKKRIRVRARKYMQGFVRLHKLLCSQTLAKERCPEKVRLWQLPSLPGVKHYYVLYERALRQRLAYPQEPLCLTS